MICPICNQPADILRSVVKDGEYFSERCERCMHTNQPTAAYARKYNRDRDREDHRKSLLQRWEGDHLDSDFARAYPERAKELFGEDEVRKYY